MGVISILLGIITFCGFTGAGAILGNKVIELKTAAGANLLALKDISNTNIMIAFIGFFGFIGLLIMMSLVLHGLTYNKVVKMYKRVRRM